jgi:hypothetical protein
LPYVVASTVELDQVLDGFPVKGTINFGRFYREEPTPGLSLSEDEKKLQEMSMGSEPVSGPLEGLLNALEKMGLSNKRIGIDELGLRKGFYESLVEKLPQG